MCVCEQSQPRRGAPGGCFESRLVKRGSIKGVIFFSLSCGKSKKRWMISGPPGMKGLMLVKLVIFIIII